MYSKSNITFLLSRLFVQRYKLTCSQTWPNHRLPDDRAASQAILKAHNFDSDATYGKTKVFIQNAQTVFELERIRDSKIPGGLNINVVNYSYCTTDVSL